jgi:hypothetical protein
MGASYGNHYEADYDYCVKCGTRNKATCLVTLPSSGKLVCINEEWCEKIRIEMKARELVAKRVAESNERFQKFIKALHYPRNQEVLLGETESSVESLGAPDGGSSEGKEDK